jgi:hypothetical protein
MAMAMGTVDGITTRSPGPEDEEIICTANIYAINREY